MDINLAEIRCPTCGSSGAGPLSKSVPTTAEETGSIECTDCEARCEFDRDGNILDSHHSEPFEWAAELWYVLNSDD